MLRRIIAILALLLIHVAPAHAETTLRVFKNTDYTTSNDGADLSRPYGGSDTSSVFVESHGGSVAEVLSFDVSDMSAGQDAIVGYFHSDRRGCQLVLHADDAKVESKIDVSSDYPPSPFRLPLPKGFVSGRLTLALQCPLSTNVSVALADVRLVRGASATTGQQQLPPFVADTLPAPETASETVRMFSGMDFDPHLSNVPGNGPLPLDLNINQSNWTATVEACVPPVESPRLIPILAVDDPPITQSQFAISGDVAYGGVGDQTSIDGYAYLEMESDFADGTAVVTRTLANSGPMHLIRGRSGPRQFLLPCKSGNKRPTRIRMRLAVSGTAHIEMSNLQLIQYLPPTTASVAATATALTAPASAPRWLNPRFTWIGITLLPFAALVAFLEPLIRRSKGRGLVIGWIWTWFAIGQICFAWGMAALGHGEPVKQIGPLLLTSATIWLAMLFASRLMGRRYRDAELKRMQLMDIVR
jgi:hypothetical protein